MDYNEFAQKIKAKYPDYSDMDNRELAQKMVAKYPSEYSDITFSQESAQGQPIGESIQSAVGGFALQSPTQGSSRFTQIANKLAQLAPSVAGAMYGAGAGVAPGAIAGTMIGGFPVGTAAGGLIGGALGAGGGAAAMRAGQLGAAAAIEGDKARTPGQVVGDVASTGLGQAAFEGGFGALGMGARAIRPYAIRAGAQLLHAGPAISEKAGQAALSDLGMLGRAPTMEQAGEQYAKTIAQDFRPSEAMREGGSIIGGGTPLISPRDLRASEGELVQKAGKATKILNVAYQKLLSNDLTPQEALDASQAGSYLQKLAGFGKKTELANSSNISMAKNAIDDFLEPIIPGFQKARQAYAEANMAEEFKSVFPLNRNMSPNVLRTLGSITTAVGGAYAHNPYIALAPFFMSPMVAGGAIRLGALAAQGGTALVRTGIPQATASGGVQSMIDSYNRRKIQESR